MDKIKLQKLNHRYRRNQGLKLGFALGFFIGLIGVLFHPELFSTIYYTLIALPLLIGALCALAGWLTFPICFSQASQEKLIAYAYCEEVASGWTGGTLDASGGGGDFGGGSD